MFLPPDKKSRRKWRWALKEAEEVRKKRDLSTILFLFAEENDLSDNSTYRPIEREEETTLTEDYYEDPDNISEQGAIVTATMTKDNFLANRMKKMIMNLCSSY